MNGEYQLAGFVWIKNGLQRRPVYNVKKKRRDCKRGRAEGWVKTGSGFRKIWIKDLDDIEAIESK